MFSNNQDPSKGNEFNRNHSNNFDESDSEEEKMEDYLNINGCDNSQPKNVYDDDSEDELIMQPKSNNSNNNTNNNNNADENRNKKTKKLKKKKEKESEKENVLLKSPICAVMGHVNAGKTSFLNYLRDVGMKYKEVNNITQSVDATTFISNKEIKSKIKNLNKKNNKINININGILFIDTPGHELFGSLRERSSLLCDIGIIIIDINHGLELQTIESLQLFKKAQKPFIILLNKIDTLLDWNLVKNSKFSNKKIEFNKNQNNNNKNLSFLKSFNKQRKYTIKDFNHKLNNIKLQLNKQGYNCSLWYENIYDSKDISLIPISANTGEGISDLLYVITNLTQKYRKNALKLKLNRKYFKCNILEIKNINGYGFVLDCILTNSIIKQGDRILCYDIYGNIIDTNIKVLLELNNKTGKYQSVKEVKASNGIRIVAKGLKDAIAGTEIIFISKNKTKEDIENIKSQMKIKFNKSFCQINNNNNDKGVFIHASQYGSLEVLKNYINTLKIPISGFRIGNLKREDITKISGMLDNNNNNKKYGCIFSYNSNISKELILLANKLNIKIIESNIIFDFEILYKKYLNSIIVDSSNAIFPVELEMNKIYRSSNPFVFGCKILNGIIKIGTPIVIKQYDNDNKPNPIYLGKIVSLEKDKKPICKANIGDKIGIKIENDENTNIRIGSNFEGCKLISLITRESIDALKFHFEDEIRNNRNVINLIRKNLKPYFEIP